MHDCTEAGCWIDPKGRAITGRRPVDPKLAAEWDAARAAKGEVVIAA